MGQSIGQGIGQGIQAYTLNIDHLNVHLEQGGNGPPLLLLHGFTVGSSRLTYGPSLAPLAAHFRVIAPDLPGYGLSDAPKTPFGTAEYATFITHLMDALGLERTHLVGFSKGGAISLGVALTAPQRVNKLVLVSSYGISARVQLPLLPYLALRTPGLGSLAWHTLRRYPRLLEWYGKRFTFGDPSRLTREILEEIRQPLSRPGGETAFMTWLRSEMGLLRYKTDYTPRLADLLPPTLLLHGARDLIVPPARSKRAATLIPGARLELFEGCGHWLPREAPERFVQATVDFLC